ncbi:MAG TPA: hypothetical protein VKU89_10340 [Solirubrobacteraceae bacterium]|nr:hypothetical protein [Solirubrobacteraceae bacterium]
MIPRSSELIEHARDRLASAELPASAGHRSAAVSAPCCSMPYTARAAL